jgi:predicted nucleic acid-binding protein
VERAALARGLLYVDASALVKLVQTEMETEALRSELRRWPNHVTSVVGALELQRVLRRAGRPVTDADPVVKNITLIAFDDTVRASAGSIGSPLLRTLDAIHLATALSLGRELGALVSYDARLNADAAAAGVSVLAPA